MQNRVNTIQRKLKNTNIDALFITSPYNISYLSGVFPSSIEEREYYLILTHSNIYLLAPKMFLLAISDRKKYFEYREITAKKGLFTHIQDICKTENIRSFGFEKYNLRYAEFEHLKSALKDPELFALEDFVESFRTIKTADEIEKTKRACEITDNCYKEILGDIKIGVTEREIASKIEFYCNSYGKNAFPAIVAFGGNAAIPHHIPGNTKLENNSFILFDFGAKHEGYCSDMSRTIYFGKPNEREITLYNTVLEAQNLALQKLKEWHRDDFKMSHLHTIAENHIKKMGLPTFPHSLGHGLGLEVHEYPSISKYSEGNELRENMIITIEPAIYVPEIGGVRIEDDVLLSSSGYEILTHSPKELTIL